MRCNQWSNDRDQEAMVKVFSDDVRIINEIRTKSKVSCDKKVFSKTRHTYPLSRSMIFVNTKSPQKIYRIKRNNGKLSYSEQEWGSYHFKDLEWLGEFHYLCSIFIELNILNTSLRSSGEDCFFIEKQLPWKKANTLGWQKLILEIL